MGSNSKVVLVVIAVAFLTGLIAYRYRRQADHGQGVAFDSGGDRVQPRVGGSADDWGRMHLGILKTYEKQRSLGAPPWHTEGGDWTFFDCAVTGSQASSILIGVHSPEQTGDTRFSFGDAVLAVRDRDIGSEFLDAFAHAFHQDLPARRDGQPALHIKMHTAILGTSLRQSPDGGFGGGKGNWTATKWFLEGDGYEAEVFFNYSLRDQKVEFSEKDPDYREDLFFQLVMALRDGPLPERTPQNDLNLSASGPTFKDWRTLGAVEAFSPILARDGKSVFFLHQEKDGSGTIFRATIEHPDLATPIVRFEHSVASYYLLGRETRELLVVEQIRQQKNAMSSADPQRLWLVDVESRGREELRGSWGEKDWHLAESGISPNGRFVSVSKWFTEGKKRKMALFCLDRQKNSTVRFDVEDTPIEWIDWRGEETKPEMTIFAGSRWLNNGRMAAHLADPVTGHFEPLVPTPATPPTRHTFSPDRQKQVQLKEKKQLLITDNKSGEARTFIFHEYDRRFAVEDCVEWVNSRYLLFQGARPALIDTVTMKMNYPLTKDDPTLPLLFAPDFSFVIASREKKLLIGSVVLPP